MPEQVHGTRGRPTRRGRAAPAAVSTVSSSASAASVAREMLARGGSAADAVAAASIHQVVDAAGTYVSFAGMLVGMYREAASGRVYCIDGDYGIPAAGRGDALQRLYRGGRLGAGPLVPGYWGGLGALLGRFGALPFGDVVEPAIERCARGFEPGGRLLQRLRHRRRTAPGSVETFESRDGMVHQDELLRTLREVAARGPSYMYTGAWGERFLDVVQRAGGVISREDLASYTGRITEPISARYRDFSLFLPPSPNVGGLVTQLVLRMLERLELRRQPHFTQDADAYLKLVSGLRTYMPFLTYLLGELDEAAFTAALGGLSIRLEDTLTPEAIDALWTAIEEGRLQTLPTKKPDNTDAVAAVDNQGNIAIIIHSACSATGRDGLVVDGVSLPRMAAEVHGNMLRSGDRLSGIFSPVVAINGGRIVAAGAIHASLFEKQCATLLNVMEYGLSLDEANRLPTPLYPDYDDTGAFSEVLLSERFDPAFLAALRKRGLRFIDARESGLGRFVTEEGLDLLESPLVGVEVDRNTGAASGVTSGHYDGASLTVAGDPREDADISPPRA